MTENIKKSDEVHATGTGWEIQFEADGEPRKASGFNTKEGGLMFCFERMGYARTYLALSDEALLAMMEIAAKLIDGRKAK